MNFEFWKSFPKLWGLQTDFDLFAEDSSLSDIINTESESEIESGTESETESGTESENQLGKNEEPRKARQWIERIETNKDRMVLSETMFEMMSNDDKITKDRVETLMECGSRFLLEWRCIFFNFDYLCIPILTLHNTNNHEI